MNNSIYKKMIEYAMKQKILLEAKWLFHWCYPELPDDLSFFKDGLWWFFTVAHEGYALIYTEDKEDIQYFEDIGLEFELAEHPSSKIELFYEEYEV